MKNSRFRRILLLLSGLFLLVLLIPVLAHSEENQAVEQLEKIIEKPKAVRKSLKDQGLLLEATNTMDVLSNVSGGIHRKTTLSGDLDLLLTVDIKKLVPNWRGTVFLYGLGLYGQNPSRNVGDIQGVSNIAGHRIHGNCLKPGTNTISSNAFPCLPACMMSPPNSMSSCPHLNFL